MNIEKVINLETVSDMEFKSYCEEIDKEIATFKSASAIERQLDVAITKVQRILIEGNAAQKNEIFNLVFERFQFFIKKIISRLFLMNLDKEDLMQEATMYFYNSILKYNKDRGAFTHFSRTYIQRNVWTLLTKSQKHKKSNISFISLDAVVADDGKTNYDDYLYYQSFDNMTIEDNIISNEQIKDCLNKIEDNLTEKEKVAMYLYLQGSSYNEIAIACNTCEKSIDNSLHRAKTKLKNIYKKDFA